MKTFLKAYTPAIIWAITVFVLSAVPGDNIPMPPILNADKIAHLGVYFILCAALIYGFLRADSCANINKSIVVAILISVLFGGMLEILQQHLFVGRFGDILDFAANSTGAILAGLLVLPFKNKILKLYS